jgi:hydrogenase maturation protease
MSTGKLPRASIIGLGNVLLGDDGFGPCAVEMFRSQYECGPDVEIIDVGTPGLDLSRYLYGRDLVVIVDAINAANEPGTLCVVSSSDIAREQVALRLTGHDPGLTEALIQLRLVNQAPTEVVVVGVIPKSCAFNQGISAKVSAGVPAALNYIAGLLVDRGMSCTCRPAPFAPNLWWLSDIQLREVTTRAPLTQRPGDRELEPLCTRFQ